MKELSLAMRLALSDYWHEKLLSACSILSLAAMLAPLLVLFGVRHGIVTAMQDRLLQDPRNLELIPEGSGKYSPEWFDTMKKREEVAFILPQTRTIAATMQLRAGEGSEAKRIYVSVIGTAAQDPLLSHWEANPTEWNTDAPPFSMAVSDSVARKLEIKENESVLGEIDRRRNGITEHQSITLKVARILPLEVQQKDTVYISLSFLTALEDYRDGREVPLLGWQGDAAYEGARDYPTFRLYAKNLDDVEPLRLHLLAGYIPTTTQAESIERVKNLNTAFTTVFALICGASTFGFVASTASSALAGVRRKSRSLGVIRLLGFSRSAMMLFPVVQSITTAIVGFFLALLLYLAVAFSIDALFASSLPGGESICTLLPLHLVSAFIIVCSLSAVSALSAAFNVSTIEPSEVIRDV